jgi:hypothetical protein
MDDVSTSMRPVDLVNSRQSRLEAAEEVIAVDRLPLCNVASRDFGFSFKLNSSERFREWLSQRPAEQTFLLKSYVLDRFGNYLLLTCHPCADAYGAISSWNERSKAAEYLRVSGIGPKAESIYGPAALAFYTKNILEALRIPEQPLNAHEIPSYSATKWGTLLRLDSSTSPQALAYLCVDQPAEDRMIFVVNLGAKVLAVLAWNSAAQEETLRLGLCSQWTHYLAAKELARWMKSLSKQKEIPA